MNQTSRPVWCFGLRCSLWLVLGLVSGAVAAESAGDNGLDTDYDGRSDRQEALDKTDPANPSSVLPVRLGYWRFNTGDLKGEEGQVPLESTNVLPVLGFDGTALRLAARGTARLVYRDVEPDGSPNISLRNGSIRFWFRTGWGTYDTPGRWMRLVEMGSWKLSIDPTSQRLVFQTQDRAGNAVTNLQVAVYLTRQLTTFDSGVRWHEIVLNYTPSYSALIVDGEFLPDTLTANLFGRGVTDYPSTVERGRGFSIGSAIDGSFPVLGAIDELETFNHPIRPDSTHFFKGKTVLSGSGGDSPGQIRLNWYYDFDLKRSSAGDGNTVQRRVVEPDNWLSDADWRPMAVVTNALSYTDATAQPGTHYEYRVGDASLLNERYIQAGIDLPPVERRGRVLLLVAKNVASGLATSLTQLRRDLAGDGWEVAFREAPTHDDAVWANNVRNIALIKSWIADEWSAHSNQFKAVFLLGHVAIPYSGRGPEDGHKEEIGAWGADSYYGDLDGQFTDTLQIAPGAPEPWRNVAGDGKFDQDWFPTNRAGLRGLEVAVGRVDFARLPAFARQSEKELLRQYLDKDHRFRHKQIVLPERAIVGTYFGEPFNSHGKCAHFNALRAASALWGGDDERVRFGDIFQPDNACLFGLQGGFGAPDGINNSADFNRGFGCVRFTSADFANPAKEPAVLVYVLAGSYFMNWNFENDLMRAALATPNYGLVSLSGYGVNWRFDPLGAGFPIGDAMVKTSLGQSSHMGDEPIGYNTIRLLAVLGDPTLRLRVTAPARDVKGSAKGNRVTLTWTSPHTPAPQYLVYRSVNGLDGPFSRLTANAGEATTFTDTAAPRGAKLYQVRVAERVLMPGGSFTNLSQGAFVEVR